MKSPRSVAYVEDVVGKLERGDLKLRVRVVLILVLADRRPERRFRVTPLLIVRSLTFLHVR